MSETIETQHLDDRGLMLATYHLTVENGGKLDTLNGTVNDHNDEIYGDPSRDIAGLKPTLRKLMEKVRTWQAFGAALGVGLIWLGVDRIL